MAKDRDDFKVLHTLTVPPSALVLKPEFQGRVKPVEEESVCFLADSIRQEGQQQPIQVREIPNEPGKYEVLFGNTRARAGMMLASGYKTLDGNNKPKDIPADPNFRLRVEVVNATDEQAFKRNISENNARNQCTIIDTAKNQEELRTTHGMTDAAIARLYGWSGSSGVNRAKSLLRLPEFVQDLIHRGQVPASGGYALAEKKDLIEAGEDAFRRVFEIAKQNGPSHSAPNIRFEECSYSKQDIEEGIKAWAKEEAEKNKPTDEGKKEEGQKDEGGNQGEGSTPPDTTPASVRVPKTLKQVRDFLVQTSNDQACPPKTKEVFVTLQSFLKDEIDDLQTLRSVMNLFDEHPLEVQATEKVEEPGHVHVDPNAPDETSMNPHTKEGQSPATPQPVPNPAEVPPQAEPAPKSDDPQAPAEGTPQAPVPATEPQAPKPVEPQQARRGRPVARK